VGSPQNIVRTRSPQSVTRVTLRSPGQGIQVPWKTPENQRSTLRTRGAGRCRESDAATTGAHSVRAGDGGIE